MRGPTLRQRAQPECVRQFDEIARAEPAKTDASDTGVTAHEPGPTGIGQPTQSRRDDRQHSVYAKTPEGEQDRTPGRPVRPLQIVDDEHHDPVIGLQVIEEVQQLRSDGHRVRPELR